MRPPLPYYTKPSCPRASLAGFTLVELIQVIAIVILLAGLSTQVIRVDTQNADVNAAASNFNGILRNARWEARSKSTFVWLCLKPTQANEEKGVRVVMLASRDGTDNADPANLTPTGSILLKRVSLGATGRDTPERLRHDYEEASIDPSGIERLGGSTITITDGGSQQFSDQIVRYNPHGELSIPGKAAAPILEVLFHPQVTGDIPDAKTSTVLLSRATGASWIFR
jgi:Tfp pilus assembly protein FimT